MQNHQASLLFLGPPHMILPPNSIQPNPGYFQHVVHPQGIFLQPNPIYHANIPSPGIAQHCPTDQPEAITSGAASPQYSPFISHDEGLLNLRIGSLNVLGFKFNLPFIKSFLDSTDICCIQELWLQDYKLDLLISAHEEFHAWGITPPMCANHKFCVP